MNATERKEFELQLEWLKSPCSVNGKPVIYREDALALLHPPYRWEDDFSEPQQPDWTPCERTAANTYEDGVRDAVGMIEQIARDGCCDQLFIGDVVDAVSALISVPGPVEKLLAEFDEDCPTACGDWTYRDHQRHLLQWLVSKEKLA